MPNVDKVVLDASALIALLQNETGAEKVKPHLPNSLLSTVNLYEVITVLGRYGYDASEAQSDIENLVGAIIPFSEKHACAAANIHQQTRSQGLSLGDCACLAVAQLEQAIALTADTIWQNVTVDVAIQTIR